jgi:hypothetical protein
MLGKGKLLSFHGDTGSSIPRLHKERNRFDPICRPINEYSTQRFESQNVSLAHFLHFFRKGDDVFAVVFCFQSDIQ